jgi:uncharacterized membrane protein YqjE
MTSVSAAWTSALPIRASRAENRSIHRHGGSIREMSAQSKIMRWRNVGRFCAQRVADYGELFRIELAETKTRLLHEVIALVALAVGALFTLSFLCIAIIVTAWGTPYFLSVVWGVAATWLIVTIVAFLVLRVQRPGQSFQTLQRELRRDVESVKEAIK